MRYGTFQEFWPFYLSQHSNRTCRWFHFAGTTASILLISFGLLNRQALPTLIGIPTGYLFAWIGHFVFEKNRPATFKYPIWSFRADLLMYLQMWCGKNW